MLRQNWWRGASRVVWPPGVLSRWSPVTPVPCASQAFALLPRLAYTIYRPSRAFSGKFLSCFPFCVYVSFHPRLRTCSRSLINIKTNKTSTDPRGQHRTLYECTSTSYRNLRRALPIHKSSNYYCILLWFNDIVYNY